MYLNLDTIKKHLNIDNDFTDDDEYLMMLTDVVENAVAIHIDNDLSTLENEDGKLPSALQHALLLLLANYYNNRESITNVSANNIPFSFNYLIDLFRNYEGKIN